MARDRNSRLWVCWSVPEELPADSDTVISFLSPSAEETLRKRYDGEVLSAREESVSVRRQAREIYLRLVARIGAMRLSSGSTLRQKLRNGNGTSVWWYHPVSFKDCETDPTFDRIIAVHTIIKVANERMIEQLEFAGAPEVIVDALRALYQTTSRAAVAEPVWKACLYALASRCSYFLQQVEAVRRSRQRKSSRARTTVDVALMSLWDWSVRIKYFGTLPEEIKNRGCSIGWLAWVEQHSHRAQRRPIAQIVRDADADPTVFVLQSRLGLSELAAALFDFTPLLQFLTAFQDEKARSVFHEQNVDYWPLFKSPLFQGFIDAAIPRGLLVERATARVCREIRPGVVFSFLEHFPHARAHYAGVKGGHPAAVNCAVQHASYSPEKTFLFLDPALEFNGIPDNTAVPHPDRVFAMGTFGRELFMLCGYQSDMVCATGSPRYAHVRITDRQKENTNERTVLLVGGIPTEQDLHMLDAAHTALKDMPHVRIVFRKHPFSLIDELPAFAAFRDRIEISTKTLSEDLNRTDVLVFVYSTVAEEAFLQAIQVVQWLPYGFNGSALAEVTAIPRAGSITSLRQVLTAALNNPSKRSAHADKRQTVLHRLFHPDGQNPARSIADVTMQLLHANN